MEKNQDRNLIDILDEMFRLLKNYDEVSPEYMAYLNELNEEAQNEFNRSYRKCDACGNWVDEELLIERYDENICDVCRENGYGE